MPIRKVIFSNGEYFHVFNRGVNRRKIFLENNDYKRGLETLEFYTYMNHTQRFSFYNRLSQSKKQEYFQNISGTLITIVAFVFMPNHFHLLIRQQEEGGISEYLSLFQNSYTRYFNTKHKRIGHLFQGQFKAVHVEDSAQLLHLSRYIHLNPFSSRIVSTMAELEIFPWSSYPQYIQHNPNKIIQNNIVLEQFSDTQTYKDFVSDQSLYQQELEDIKHLALE